jgi:hypothetical protein
VYVGGGVGRGVVAAVDESDGAFDSEEEPELEDVDFFLLSPGLTMAICDGFVESAITTRAIMGARTLVGSCETFLFLLLLDKLLSLPSARPFLSPCGLSVMDSRGRTCVILLKRCLSVLHVSTRDRSEISVRD